MGLTSWLWTLLRLNKKSDCEKTIQELRREIKRLRKENNEIREKIIC